jgi:type 1 fimbriae regulatory protein FimB/type 1 fimbriae regulatory protein FimE
MILIGYRHGLRAAELCDLQWSQIELATGRLHVRREKNGSPSVHPMQGDETNRCPPPARGAQENWDG